MTAPVLRAPAALLPDGWRPEARLVLSPEGRLTPEAAGNTAAEQRLGGWVVPGMPNAHSHAFQRAMAGWAEHLDPHHPADSFWTWRDAMYGLAARISPEDLEAIAAQLYLEMLEAGYTAVAEFHYLHHDRNGAPYADPAELSRALLRAADQVGIRITLLPVFYAHAGIGQPLGPMQRRFGHASVEGFARLLEALSAERHRVGLAAHSLRAVAPDELTALAALADGPLHIHIAEQPAEVAQCLQAWGARPVAWLLEHAPVDRRWCLVHATHTTPDELRGMAKAGCVVALCPTTEANLGDGLFDLPCALDAGLALAVGSDSHITVDPREELRLLEYGQRLQRLARNVAAGAGGATGQRLWQAAAQGGAQAIGQPLGALVPGAFADLVVLDPAHPRLLEQRPETLLDALIFSTSAESPVRDVFVGGRQVVSEGRHPLRAAVRARYAETLRRLQGAP